MVTARSDRNALMNGWIAGLTGVPFGFCAVTEPGMIAPGCARLRLGAASTKFRPERRR
jgi:hypothetical protein